MKKISKSNPNLITVKKSNIQVPISSEIIKGESWFKISNFDSMSPFFMSIVSNSNHWMFISSNGGLTAGRKNAEYALFPYYTVDKIHELSHTTGSKSIFQVETKEGTQVWEPFSDRDGRKYNLSRNLYKNKFGNKIMFEEINHDLELKFSYQWNSSNLYGFVKKSSIENLGSQNLKLTFLDGIQNIMPYGVSSDLQVKSSNLVDGYKRSELVSENGMGIYALSAIIVDKAEPSEALKANAVFSLGLDNPAYLLSSDQLDDFRMQQDIFPETDMKGEKGAYFVSEKLEIEANEAQDWSIVANVNLNHAHVARLNQDIKENENLEEEIYEDVERGTQKLIELVAGADGLQHSSDILKNARHYSNTLFNIMRGGTFDENYLIEKEDFVKYLKNASKRVFEDQQSFIDNLPEAFDRFILLDLLSDVDDADLLRLSKEYLPLKFSRRHGDPSRPWNIFTINTHNEEDGSKILDYEGNWRDIFQNWEALGHSYPEFVEGMIFKFLNATTFDGYNPYRVTKDGFDWEVIEPDDPWSYIGYWGDHQIIYLLKFLEFYNQHNENGFDQLLEQDIFVYANVPYIIKPYGEIVQDPKDTIVFDEESDKSIRENVAEKGADGALLSSKKADIHRVNFTEKILATVLAKVSNFIPEAGIWMNTQRPEWNDANNALVGNGVSMVTLYYLRRFLKFWEPIFDNSSIERVEVSEELAEFFKGVTKVLTENETLLNDKISDKDRKTITDGLGIAGSNYRTGLYKSEFSGVKTELLVSEISELFRTTRKFLEHSIEANKRTDDLYHAYNIMSMGEDGISISYLDEMLEGQVAVLSSGYLKAKESLEVLGALRNSSLYRDDQMSYLLYPNKDLPGFLEKNIIPESSVKKSDLLQKLVTDGNSKVLNQDIYGEYHFNGNFKNARDLKDALSELEEAKEYSELVKSDRDLVLQIFEEVFNHKAFTGRSGTFFAFEGLGSIYWHMVSKLHVAVYEVCEEAVQEESSDDIINGLFNHFDEIAKGIGVHKSPELYGAFPIDPYSHTPAHRGAQQPGMTGQVKEDMLVRFGELGISVEDGALNFSPFLLKEDEFLNDPGTFELKSLDQESYEITIPKKSLAFTYCQVPVKYSISDKNFIEVQFNDGTSKTYEETKLDKEISEEIFQRSGKVTRINVSLTEKQLR